jgi:uncharacterized protein YaiI (UPF0178 family)
MQIYIDADACPKNIKEILYRTAERRKIQLNLVANKFLRTPESSFIKTIIVPGGQDIADDKIVELITEGDLVITADIPLADRVIEKHSFAINPRGSLYTKENIKQFLSNRNFLTELRNNGIETGGPAPFTTKDSHEFANQLDRFLTKMIKSKK